jgi:hypothetical protein
MKKTFLFAFMVIGMIAVSCKQTEPAFKGDFINPSVQYRVTGGLSLVPRGSFGPNGPIKAREIKDTIQWIKESLDKTFAEGYGGVNIGPSRNPYFTPQWFDKYRIAAEYSKEKGKQIVMYDDIEYPSGTAGDRIATESPENRVRLLTKTEKEYTGPIKTLNVEMPYEGEFLGTVAFNPDTKERINISSKIAGKHLSWSVPEGKWKIMTYSIVQRGRMIDLMDDAAVDKYIELVYEKYNKELGNYFGKVINKNFFDDIGFWYMINPWNKMVNKIFESRYGLDPLLYMPALWYDIGEDTQASRVAFFSICSERMGDAFAKRLTDWCAAHGFNNMGHVPGAYDANPTFMNGDPFKFYKYQQIPYIDLLTGYLYGRPNIKITSSVATLYNRPFTGTEIFGAYSFIDGDMLYRVPMEASIRGISFYVSFAAGRTNYDGNSYREKHPQTDQTYIKEWNDFMGRTSALLQGGRSVVDIALVFPIESLHAWEKYAEDIIEHEKKEAAKPKAPEGGMFSFGGASPITAGGAISYANFGNLSFGGRGTTEFKLPEARDTVGPGKHIYPSTDYNKISDLLTNQLRRDFTYVEADEFTQDKFSIDKGVVKLNTPDTWQQYKLIIMPSQLLVNVSMLEKLKSFYLAGGRILFTGQLPLKAVEFGQDAKVKALVKELLGVDSQQREKISVSNAAGGQIVYLPLANQNDLTSVIDQLLPDPDVRITPVQALTHQDLGNLVIGVDIVDRGGNLPDQYLGELSYVHKVKDNKDIYYFINSSNHEISTTVKIAGKKKLEQWNPHNGMISEWETKTINENGMKYTVINLKLEPVSALAAVGK